MSESSTSFLLGGAKVPYIERKFVGTKVPVSNVTCGIGWLCRFVMKNKAVYTMNRPICI